MLLLEAAMLCQQVLQTDILTLEDWRAEGMVGPALQTCLAMMTADAEADGLEAATGLLQHLIPSHKHLSTLHQHIKASETGLLFD